MDDPGLGDDLVDRHPGVERLGGVLEHHLDFAAHGVEVARRHGEEVAALPERAAAVGVDEAEDGLGDGGLAGAALADDGEDLALLQLEGDVVEGLEGAVVLAGALDLEDRLGALAGCRHLAAAGGGGDQLAGVGVLGVVVDLVGGAGLDDLAAVHHHDAVGGLGDDAEVVGDEDEAEAHLDLELLEELQDLGLDRDVEGGGGLVGDDDVGLHRQRHGDHHALALAAGELVGVFGERGGGVGDADAANEVEGAGGGLRRGDAVDAHDLAELPADGPDRVEVAERVLEDHCDALAVDAAALVGGGLEQVAGRRRGSRRRRSRRAGSRSGS